MNFDDATYQAMLCADKNGYTGREVKIYELYDEWIYLIFSSEEITKGIISTPKLDRLQGFLKGNMRRFM